jgi:hypothetical protein
VSLRLFVIVAFQLVLSTAQACRFAQDAQPAQWYEWSDSLFSADVTGIALDQQKSVDIITVRVVETFKGTAGAAATLRVPSRMWASCRLERPAAGAHVLVALNPNSDTLLVPLTPGNEELLRRHPGRQPQSQPQPQPAPSSPATEKPFSY